MTRIARNTSALLAALAIGGAASIATAADVHNEVAGRVAEVRVDNDLPRGMVCFDRDLSSVACGTNKKCLGFTTNTDQGRAALSVALAALTSGKRVLARGLDTCSAYPAHTHDLLHLNVQR